MSYVHNAPWTPSEKVTLLVNILQSAFPDLSSFLMHLIQEYQVYPKWNDIPLPQDRSLHSCQICFEEMSRVYRQQGRQPQQHVPLQYQAAPSIAPALPAQKQFHEPEIYHTQQRALQPRPPRSTDSPIPVVTNGESAPTIRTLAPEPVQEVRKKRGRPSKEEAEERDRALAAEGKVYQPKKRPTKKLRASTGTPTTESSKKDTTSTPLQTPPGRGPGSAEESYSGRRWTRRPSDEETDVKPELRAAAHDEEPEEAMQAVAQSPSDRLLANHRERQSSPPSQGPPVVQAPPEGGTKGT